MEAGENVGVLLRGIKAAKVERGMIICPPDKFTSNNHFKASVYFLTKHEGGRSRLVPNGYIQHLYSHTLSVEARFDLPGSQEMLMPGDGCEMYCTILKDMVIEPHQKFTIRENHQTVGTGIISSVLPFIKFDKGLSRVPIDQIRNETEPVEK